MAMRVWRVMVAAATVLAWAGFALAGARADAPDATGWWWAGRPSPDVPALFKPVPEPPTGGLYVAGGPNGPSGISAVRHQLADGATVSTLTLHVVDAVGTPLVVACPTATAWEPAENGGWETRPSYVCDAGGSEGAYDAAAKTVTMDVSSMVDPTGVIDLVLVGGVDPQTTQPATFAVAFEPPGDDAFDVVPPFDFGPDDGGDGDFGDDPAPDFGVGELFDPILPQFPDLAGPVTTTTVAAAPEARGDVEAAPARTRPIARRIGTDGFAYPAVLALPLGLLLLGGYVMSTLSRPIRLAAGSRR